MKTKKISTKIKTIGVIFFFLMLSILITTNYLNKKNEKDAATLHIASSQSMLTQKISKIVFYTRQVNSTNFKDLNIAIERFSNNLKILKLGDLSIGIVKSPTLEISKQLTKVETFWNYFNKNVSEYKKLSKDNQTSNKILVNEKIETIFKTNTLLLQETDKLINLYILYSEEKIDSIEKFQYLAALVLLILVTYGFTQFRQIESHAQEFLNYSKEIIDNPDNTHLKPINIDAESEIVEATDTLNCFINKVNSAMDYSAVAIEQSKNASSKLVEITDEFDKVLDELKDSTHITKHLDKTEDMVIESTEELINSTKKLQKLKDELDKLLNSLTKVSS